MKQNKNFNKKRVIFLVLSILWMSVIFWFSAQNGEESAAKSLPLAELLHIPEWMVRKGAHMTEYAVLSALLFGFFHTFYIKQRKAGMVSWLVSVIYAVTDEFHQMFSDGRTPSARDVCIDAAGAFAGVLVAIGIFLLHKKKLKKEKRTT